MAIAADKVRPIQNIGFVDRIIRFAIGAVLLGTVVLYYEMEHPMLTDFGQVLAVIISLYPLWTCSVGWDPLYALAGVRSGGDSGRNQLGTFPYQMKAAFGRPPRYCDIHDEKSLEACREKPDESPMHPHWAVDREPIMYPDRHALDEFFSRHPGPEAVKK